MTINPERTRPHTAGRSKATVWLAAVGAAVTIAGYAAVPWLNLHRYAQFHHIGRIARQLGGGHGHELAVVYFGWLGWVFLAASLLLALVLAVRAVRGGAPSRLRWTVVMAAVAFGAVHLAAIHNLDFGFHLATGLFGGRAVVAAGFALLAIAGAVAPPSRAVAAVGPAAPEVWAAPPPPPPPAWSGASDPGAWTPPPPAWSPPPQPGPDAP